jgi:hypothetical protein
MLKGQAHDLDGLPSPVLLGAHIGQTDSQLKARAFILPRHIVAK